jgi:hypothetical protein
VDGSGVVEACAHFFKNGCGTVRSFQLQVGETQQVAVLERGILRHREFELFAGSLIVVPLKQYSSEYKVSPSVLRICLHYARCFGLRVDKIAGGPQRLGMIEL